MPNQMSRRALLTGIGAVGGAAALGTTASPAAAKPASPRRRVSAQPDPGGARPATPPSLPAPIASAPQVGVSYKFLNWHDFAPEDHTTYGRAYGGAGAYTDITSDYLAAFTDIPPGALIHDVEYYLSNSIDVTLFGITWVSGTGGYSAPYWLQQTHAANPDMHAVKFAVPSSLNGPFPFGTRIGVSILTPTDRSVQINGARIGLSRAPLSTVLLPAPVRVYNTTTSSTPIVTGQTRTVALDAQLPIGANAALFTLTAFNTQGAGAMRAGAAGGSVPIPALRWARTGDAATDSVTSPVSAARAIAVSLAGPGAQTDLFVDLVGYLI